MMSSKNCAYVSRNKQRTRYKTRITSTDTWLTSNFNGLTFCFTALIRGGGPRVTECICDCPWPLWPLWRCSIAVWWPWVMERLPWGACWSIGIDNTLDRQKEKHTGWWQLETCKSCVMNPLSAIAVMHLSMSCPTYPLPGEWGVLGGDSLAQDAPYMGHWTTPTTLAIPVQRSMWWRYPLSVPLGCTVSSTTQWLESLYLFSLAQIDHSINQE